MLAALKADPKEFIRQMDKLGLNHQEIIKEMIYEAIQEERLTPEQKATRNKLDRLKVLEGEKVRSDQMVKQAQHAREVEEHKVRLAGEITQAVEKVGLPNDKEIIARVAYYMAYARQQGTDLTAEQAAVFAKGQYGKELARFMTLFPEDRLKDNLPKELLDKIRKMDMEELKAKDPKKEKSGDHHRSGPKKEKTITMEEHRERMKERWSKMA